MVTTDLLYIERATFAWRPCRPMRKAAHGCLRPGHPPREHSVLRQAELAETLERLAAEGHAGFYQGTTAQRLLQAVQAAGGIWQAEDLRDYRVVERPPLRFALGEGRELISAPPPQLAVSPWRKAPEHAATAQLAGQPRRGTHSSGGREPAPRLQVLKR